MVQPDPTPIFRITHYSNLPAILNSGIFCSNHPSCSTSTYQSIGDLSLISRRNRILVPVAQKGVLNDYVPFYLGPRSPMLFVINKANVTPQSEVVYLVCHAQTISKLGLPFAFTDGHAYEAISQFHDDLKDLAKLDWDDIYRRERWNEITPEHPHRRRHKQAEFLVYQHVPVNALLGIAVYDDNIRAKVEEMVHQAGLVLPVKVYRPWYY